MIEPLKCAARIVLNDALLAEPLFDLMLWADQPNLKDNNDYDEILELLYLKTQHCRDARAVYARDRNI